MCCREITDKVLWILNDWKSKFCWQSLGRATYIHVSYKYLTEEEGKRMEAQRLILGNYEKRGKKIAKQAFIGSLLCKDCTLSFLISLIRPICKILKTSLTFKSPSGKTSYSAHKQAAPRGAREVSRCHFSFPHTVLPPALLVSGLQVWYQRLCTNLSLPDSAQTCKNHRITE